MARVGLSSARLARMRATVGSLMPDTAIIQAASIAPDGKGGFEETWSAVAGGTVICRLDPMPKPVQPDQMGFREAIANQRMLTVPYDAPLAVARRVIVGTESYEVRDLHEDHSWRAVRRAIVTKVEGA